MASQYRLLVAALLVLASGIVTTSAQTLDLTKEQRLKVYRTLIKESVAAQAPPEATIIIGQDLPASIDLYAMPVYVVDDTPAAGAYRFTIWNNQVVLVDKASRKVVAVVRE
jgi:hypothetical protein